MKTRRMIAAIGLTSALLALDAVAAKPGRPEAPTRGIGVVQAEPMATAGVERNFVRMGRPEALTRGVVAVAATPVLGFASGLTPEQKTGRPEFHTRGIYCFHRGRRG